MMKAKKLFLSTLLVGVFILITVTNAFAADIVVNRYYSIYDPSKFNDPHFHIDYDTGKVTLSSWDYLQHRQNCYGYALQLYRKGTINRPYKQQPGEFRSTSDASKVVGNIVTNNPSKTMQNVVSNMKLDAARLGYSMSEYSTTSSTVAQYGNGRRLIALVTGNSDYHYYMQHNDGTWSHKPGITEVTNLSLDDNVRLTNRNIKKKANQESYSGGSLKFFIIRKDAIADYPHGSRPTSSSRQTSLFFTDVAGEERTTASRMTTPQNGFFDGINDYDTFYYTPSSTGEYVITTTSGVDIDAYVYSSDASQDTPLGYDTRVGDVDLGAHLVKGKRIYIKLRNYDQTMVDYVLNVQKK